jgi:glycosyltransferase involved in cell wall biosynthesis
MSLSIILPTINEKDNLEFLIPEIYSRFSSLTNIEVIVVDDGSTDDTGKLMEQFGGVYPNIRYIERSFPDGLPKAIQTGVTAAQGDLVAWLDADGSMPIRILTEMYQRFMQENLDIIIGSRFVANGGFKGLNEKGKTSFLQFLENLRNSQDSFLAVVLSRVLNIFLRIVLQAGVKDMTSGFIIVKKSVVQKEEFIGRYGEYFPILMKNLSKRNLIKEEFGYVCLPRIHGTSKTGSSMRQYLSKGLPYVFYSTQKVLFEFPVTRYLIRDMKILKSRTNRF